MRALPSTAEFELPLRWVSDTVRMAGALSARRGRYLGQRLSARDPLQSLVHGHTGRWFVDLVGLAAGRENTKQYGDLLV